MEATLNEKAEKIKKTICYEPETSLDEIIRQIIDSKQTQSGCLCGK